MTDGSAPGVPPRAGDEPPPQSSRATHEASGPNLRPQHGYGGLPRCMAAAVGQQQGAAAHAAPPGMSPSTQASQAQDAQSARTQWGAPRARTAAQEQAALQQQASEQGDFWQTPQASGLHGLEDEGTAGATARSREGARRSSCGPGSGDPSGGRGAAPSLSEQLAQQGGGSAPPHALGDGGALQVRNEGLLFEVQQLQRQLLESRQREQAAVAGEREAVARLSRMSLGAGAQDEAVRERPARITSEYFKPLSTTEAAGCKISMQQRRRGTSTSSRARCRASRRATGTTGWQCAEAVGS